MRRSLAFFFLGSVSVLLTACGGDDDTVGDAGPADAMADSGFTCHVPDLLFSESAIGTTPGVTRRPSVELSLDYCHPTVITLTSSDTGVATVSPMAPLEARHTRAAIDVTGVSVGTATITATFTAGEEVRTATMDVTVTDPALPACDGSASGTVSPGTEVRVATGLLAGAYVALPSGASADNVYRVEPFAVDIACAPSQVPDGYGALGPAVSFGPAHLRFGRDVPMGLPYRPAMLPENGHRGHVEVSYTGPGVPEPRIVPVAVTAIPLGGDVVFEMEAPRLGTYQVVARANAGATRERQLTYRGIVGASMGGIGTGVVGFRNPELWDFVAPLGAAWDWAYLLDYIHNYHVGGFCTEAQREADPGSCNASSVARTPPRRWMHEVTQDYEHWWYDEGIRGSGHGSRFDRREYANIFRDLAYMYGNSNTDRAEDPTAPNVTPPGIADSERLRTDAERCTSPVIIPPTDGSPATGFFDDEYNPEGLYPVMTYCEGAEIEVEGERDVGVWDPAGTNDYPMEVALAVDVNANGTRDPGEPVIRNFHEPFEDCGLDTTCSASEAGYDAVTNLDPAGDDYDPQYNPAGTEGNFLRDADPAGGDAGEAYVDNGLDGVAGTPQLADGGFDHGEGNGVYDMSRGAQRMIDRGPKHLVLRADEDALRNIDVFGDGGIRDLFMAATAANHTFSAFPARGRPLRYLNGHSRFHFDGRPQADDMFDFASVHWFETGPNVLVRYGNVDASAADYNMGDGAHVGTLIQAVNRILSPMVWMSARWPNGDRLRVTDSLCRTGAGCPNPNQIITDFTSPTTGRTGPVSIILPPGYFQPEHASDTYPVIYFLHGYGMEPQQLIDVAILTWNYMIANTLPEARRLQKMIFVFPDGRCRSSGTDIECLKGTFYTDAPESTPGGAQMETFLLDLVEHIDANYRTRPAETVTVIE